MMRQFMMDVSPSRGLNYGPTRPDRGLGMPVFGHEITLQVDLATTAIAVMAFLVSFWLGWRQSQLDVESLRQQRDTDIIHWSNSALGACCHAEMLLRWDYASVIEHKDRPR